MIAKSDYVNASVKLVPGKILTPCYACGID